MAAVELKRLFADIEQLFAAGQWQAAEQAVGQLLVVAPHEPRTWAYRGAIHLQAGQLQEAENCFCQATMLNPRDAASWHHLSMALLGLDRPDEAEGAALQAVAIGGSRPAFLLQLGHVLLAQHKLTEAVGAFKRSVEAEPLNINTWNNLAAAYHLQKQWSEARGAYEASLALEPDQLETRLKLIDVVERTMAYSSAEKLAEQATVDYPPSADAWSVLGRIRLNLAKQEDAIGALRRAVQIEPSPYRHSRLLQALQYEQDVTSASLLADHAAWGQRYEAGVTQRLTAIPEQSPLRIGFVSNDFGISPVGHMVLPVLKALAKRTCFTACYFDNREQDRLTAEFQAAVDVWRVTFGLTDDALAEQIRADKIDVLIDLTGHAGNRLVMFVRKPARVQVTWFGYVGTTGLKSMDYLLADRYHVRSGEEKYYSEAVLRMPHGYACYGTPDYAAAVANLPALSTGRVTFGCFNNPTKWTPSIMEAWADILRQVPSARLFLKYYGLDDPKTQELFRSWFGKRGIESERISLEGRSEHRKLFEAYNRVDLALDTQPYSGGVTTCEALWMGVPVITWPGESFAGRHATSHLTNAGFEQFIARDRDEYVTMSVEWVTRLDELAEIRSTMRERMRQSPLCDAKQFAADFLALLSGAVASTRHQQL